MCLRDRSLTVCQHPECIVFPVLPQTPGQFNLNKVMESLTFMLINRQSMLASLYDSTKLLLDKTETLKMPSPIEGPEKVVSDHPFMTANRHEFKIVPVESPPSLVYKEKGFELLFKVEDSLQNLTDIKEIFKVKLFTSENPPKLLKLNISSKKIMRGTLEGLMNDKRMVLFENIVINEVTSHYVNETFNLVVTCENNNVQPFVIENLNVRARNFHKKAKGHN